MSMYYTANGKRRTIVGSLPRRSTLPEGPEADERARRHALTRRCSTAAGASFVTIRPSGEAAERVAGWLPQLAKARVQVKPRGWF